MPSFLFNFSEQVQYLKNLPTINFHKWAAKALREEITTPIALHGDGDASSLFLDLYRYSESKEFQERIGSVILSMMNSWHETLGFDYINKLIYIAGNIGLRDCYRRFIEWLEEGSLKGKPGLKERTFFKEDAHMNCWQAIGGCSNNECSWLPGLALRDIEDERYFFICYKVLYERRIQYLVHFFPRFLKLCMKSRDPFVQFNNAFHHINKNFGKKFFQKFQRSIFPRLTKSEREFFSSALIRVRYPLNA